MQLHDWIQLGAGEHRLEIPGPVGTIDAIVHIPELAPLEEMSAIAICCHPHPLYEGTMTNKVVHTLAKVMTKMGILAVRFNFRGVGRSQGTYDEGVGETSDLLFLCRQMSASFPRCPLWLSGFSFGSYIAANAAADAGAAQLITISPPVEHFDFTQITDPACPWLVVMGEEDEIVSPNAVFDWVAQNPERYQLMRFPDTGHFYHGKLVKLTDQLLEHYQMEPGKF